MSDKEFVGGLIAKPPHEKAPEFVKCNLSLKRVDLIAWLMGKSDEWINVDVKSAKSWKWYAELSQWKPKPKDEQSPISPQRENDLEGNPF